MKIMIFSTLSGLPNFSAGRWFWLPFKFSELNHEIIYIGKNKKPNSTFFERLKGGIVKWKKIKLYATPYLDIPILRGISFIFSGLLLGLLVSKKQKPDIIISAGLPSTLTGFLVSRIIKKRIIMDYCDPFTEIYVKGGTIPPFLRKFSDWIENFLIKHCDEIVVNQKYLKERAEKCGRKPVFIPTGTDLKLFRKKPNKKAVIKKYNLDNSKVVTLVASLQKRENVDFFLKSAKIVSEIDKNVKFLIVGGGPERKNLEKLTYKLNLKDKVIFTGLRPHSEIPDILAASDICVIPVDCGSTNKMYEYMAMGKPIVALRGEIIALKQNISGILTSHTPHCFAQGIIKLLKDKKLCRILSKNVKKEVKKYDWDRIAKKYLRFIVFKKRPTLEEW